MFTKVGIKFHGRDLTIESGKIAKQASASVVVRYGDTVALVTVVAEKNQQLLELYQSGRPYRQPPPASGSAGPAQ